VVSTRRRQYAFGPDLAPPGVDFRIWAPARREMAVVVDGHSHPLKREQDGFFSTFVPEARAGSRYGFSLDGGTKLFPDPASRSQPEGPHELSAIVDANAFRWSDESWTGPRAGAQAFYEMHVGTFTPEGTWRAAKAKLPDLVELGVTAIEMMPVNEFGGDFGWGYDGVDLWAPTHLYGTPDDFRAFVDAAHAHGLAVVLDVVYNHLGPDGNYLAEFAPQFFTKRYKNEWGEAINFDGEDSAPVREFFAGNAAYWIREFHLDGLRLDATQSILDASDEHVLALISRRAREAAGGRRILLIAENEPQDICTVADPAKGGHGLDAMWNDDFHHSARVALTGQIEAYYADYRGRPQEFVSMAKFGFLFQGQWYSWQKQRRGTSSLRAPRRSFVWFLQNHDQIANSPLGRRIDRFTSAPALRAMTALLLLGPAHALLFQGQEFAASSPFVYFAGHRGELARQVEKGRREFTTQFPSLATEEMQRRHPRPDDRAQFERCRLDWNQLTTNAHVVALHRDLLALRATDAVFREFDDYEVEGAVLAERAFVLRYFFGAAERLLVVNLGETLELSPVPEPLLAPPKEARWELLWSSEAPEYGGIGTPRVADEEGRWRLPAVATVVLQSVPHERSTT
jgi:maltooligosyltrehalose trehalohydrolase